MDKTTDMKSQKAIKTNRILFAVFTVFNFIGEARAIQRSKCDGFYDNSASFYDVYQLFRARCQVYVLRNFTPCLEIRFSLVESHVKLILRKATRNDDKTLKNSKLKREEH